jgi:hopene-associated glycosyltransferase HpnB
VSSTFWLLACVPGAVIWLAVLLVPWRPWSTRERIEGNKNAGPIESDSITILIPARNEAARIGRTLAAIEAQSTEIKVIVIDDRSDDDTAGIALAAGLPNLRVINGNPLPAGWTGKLWALDQGLAEVGTPLTLLLDADIELGSGMIGSLLDLHRSQRIQMVSVMATLSARCFWEKLLLPAFVYFFKLLYPFRLSNSPSRWVAAAAGGCILIETGVLREIGAFGSLKDEIIDDCALAARVKRAGHPIWIGLSRSVLSHRGYNGLGGIWEMVNRTAFTQLRYSVPLLLVCVLALSWAFWFPVAGLVFGDQGARIWSGVALAAMTAAYLPTLRFYRLSPLWALLLPLTGTLYLLMTLDSALRYARGVRSSWRGRTYGVEGR